MISPERHRISRESSQDAAMVTLQQQAAKMNETMEGQRTEYDALAAENRKQADAIRQLKAENQQLHVERLSRSKAEASANNPRRPRHSSPEKSSASASSSSPPRYAAHKNVGRSRSAPRRAFASITAVQTDGNTTNAGSQTDESLQDVQRNAEASVRQQIAPLPGRTNAALTCILRELLVVTLQDDVTVAESWGQQHARRRLFSVAPEDDELHRLMDTVLGSVVGLKRRVAMANEQIASLQEVIAYSATQMEAPVAQQRLHNQSVNSSRPVSRGRRPVSPMFGGISSRPAETPISPSKVVDGGRHEQVMVSPESVGRSPLPAESSIAPVTTADTTQWSGTVSAGTPMVQPSLHTSATSPNRSLEVPASSRAALSPGRGSAITDGPAPEPLSLDDLKSSPAKSTHVDPLSVRSAAPDTPASAISSNSDRFQQRQLEKHQDFLRRLGL